MRRLLVHARSSSWRSCLWSETPQFWPRRFSSDDPSNDNSTPCAPPVAHKLEQPYRPVYGLNLPYPKISTDMSNFVFKDMDSCAEIENAVYELWDRLTMREVEAAFFALKRLNAYPPTSLLDALAQKAMQLSDQISCRNVASIFLSAARLKYFNAALFDCLAKELMKPEKLQDLQGLFCGTTVYAMGALQRHFNRGRAEPSLDERFEMYFPLQLELLETLAERLLTVRDEAGLANKNIANFTYGLAMMQYRNEAVLNLMAEEATRPERLDLYNEQEVSNIIYSFGLLNYRHEALLSHFCALLHDPERLKGWSEQGLSNAIYGFALLEYRPPNETMFAMLWESCRERRLQRFYNQHLMNVVFGLVTLGIHSYRVLKCLLDELLSRRHKFEFMLTGLSSVVYSFAKAGIYADGIKILLQDLTLDKNLNQLTDWSLTNLMQAVGRFPDELELLEPLQKLLKEAVRAERLSRLNERHFALMLYGISLSKHKEQLDPQQLTLLIQAATLLGRVPTFTDQGLANTVFALTHLGYTEAKVYERLAEEATKRVDTFEGIPLATLVYAWGRIGYADSSFLARVAEKLKTPGVVERYGEHVLGNLLLGLVRLGVKDAAVYQSLTQRIRSSDIWNRFLYTTAPDCVEELLQAEWLEESFRSELNRSLRPVSPDASTQKMKL